MNEGLTTGAGNPRLTAKELTGAFTDLETASKTLMAVFQQHQEECARAFVAPTATRHDAVVVWRQCIEALQEVTIRIELATERFAAIRAGMVAANGTLDGDTA